MSKLILLLACFLFDRAAFWFVSSILLVFNLKKVQVKSLNKSIKQASLCFPLCCRELDYFLKDFLWVSSKFTFFSFLFCCSVHVSETHKNQPADGMNVSLLSLDPRLAGCSSQKGGNKKCVCVL